MTQQSNEQNSRPLRVILPKKGRLKDDFQTILNQADLNIVQNSSRLDYGSALDSKNQLTSFETLNQRTGDALENLNAGLADIAVVGLDRFEEASCQYGSGFNVRITGSFNLSACSLWIAGPEDTPINKPEDLENLRIITSYPHILENWLDSQNVKNVTIITREGGIEDYIRLGMADAIFDVVESGKSLEANNLVRRLKLFDSMAVLVQRKGEWSQELTAQASTITARLLGTETVAPQEKAPEKQQESPAFLPVFSAA